MHALNEKHPKRAQQLPKDPLTQHCLYISGEHVASDLDELQKLKIGAVLSLTEDPFSLPEHIEHLHLTVSDHPDANIFQHLQEAFEFIERNRKKTNVLVHCVAGVSRSAAVCVYYLMKKQGWSMEVSLARLRECRPWVRPNEGFMQQLRKAEGRLGLGFGRARF